MKQGDGQGYWVVEMKAFAFDEEDQARAFADKLTDVFMDMPEAEVYGATCAVHFEAEEATTPKGEE